MSERIIISEPRKGFYRTKLAPKALHVGVLIWFGRPIIDGQTQDRAPRWCAAVDGRTDKLDHEAGCHVPLSVHDIWPWCCDEPITHWEYAFMKNRVKWAKAHRPDHPAANPRKPIDLGDLPPLFGGKR